MHIRLLILLFTTSIFSLAHAAPIDSANTPAAQTFHADAAAVTRCKNNHTPYGGKRICDNY